MAKKLGYGGLANTFGARSFAGKEAAGTLPDICGPLYSALADPGRVSTLVDPARTSALLDPGRLSDLECG